MATSSTPISDSKSAASSAVPDRFAGILAARRASREAQEAADRAGVPRDRPADLGGLNLKLAVQGEIPGYHMYWELDIDGRIEQLLWDGFDFVAPGEVRRTSEFVADKDLSNRVSRLAGGHSENGEPLRLYLMKCPQEAWDLRQARGQNQANTLDAEIRNGRMQPKAGSGNYVPSGVQSKLETNAKVS